MNSSSVECLLKVGLTALEAEVYVFLLQEAPATGYRVAQAIGRPVGNVYKSLEALEAKGAVLTAHEGDSRVHRSVPASEFLAAMEKQFRTASGAARRTLRSLSEPPPDNRVYELTKGPQVIERCRAMLQGARRFAILTLCPAPLAELADALEASAARGVLVAVKVFDAVELAGVTVVVDPRGLAAVESGPGQWLFATVDGASMLQALCSAETGDVVEAFFSRNPLMTWASYTGLCSDLMLASLRPEIERGEGGAALKARLEVLARLEFPSSVGKAALARRYREGKGTLRRQAGR